MAPFLPFCSRALSLCPYRTFTPTCQCYLTFKNRTYRLPHLSFMTRMVGLSRLQHLCLAGQLPCTLLRAAAHNISIFCRQTCGRRATSVNIQTHTACLCTRPSPLPLASSSCKALRRRVPHGAVSTHVNTHVLQRDTACGGAALQRGTRSGCCTAYKWFG